MLQQVTVKDVEILLVEGLLEVETGDVDALAVEWH